MNSLNIPCLGRNFTPGLLYNFHNEQIIEFPELWSREVLKSATKKEGKLKTTIDVYSEDTMKNKYKILGLADANSLKLSLLSDLVEVDGAAL